MYAHKQHTTWGHMRHMLIHIFLQVVLPKEKLNTEFEPDEIDQKPSRKIVAATWKVCLRACCVYVHVPPVRLFHVNSSAPHAKSSFVHNILVFVGALSPTWLSVCMLSYGHTDTCMFIYIYIYIHTNA